MYAGRTPSEKPPCRTCRVDPLDDNWDAIRIFFVVKHQFIMGFSGPVDLNHLAIDAAMRRRGIEGQGVFNKVLILGHWWIERIRNKDGE